MEEPSSVDTRGRNSSTGFHGRTFFHNSSAVCLAEEVLPWDSTKEGSSVVDMTTVEESFSVESRERTSFESVNRRALFLKNKNA